MSTIAAADGTQVASFSTAKASDSFAYSSDLLGAGTEYSISVGGQVAGALRPGTAEYPTERRHPGTTLSQSRGAACGGAVIPHAAANQMALRLSTMRCVSASSSPRARLR